MEAGRTVQLHLPEMGIHGSVRVEALGDCVVWEEGPGRRVTGVFRHNAGVVYDWQVEGESKPIRVTGTHPVWSVDRQGWVQVKDLRIGERLQGLKGKTPRVVSLSLREEPEPVFNIEVEGDHCYRVGEQGILVHNASAPTRAWPHCNKIPPAGHERDYQLHACGSVEYEISGNGQMKCADTVEGTIVVDCKALTNPRSSPQLGTAPQFITQAAIAQWSRDLREYQTVISDPCSGLTKLVIRVEDQRQVAFWQMLLQPLTIAKDVEVVP